MSKYQRDGPTRSEELKPTQKQILKNTIVVPPPSKSYQEKARMTPIVLIAHYKMVRIAITSYLSTVLGTQWLQGDVRSYRDKPVKRIMNYNVVRYINPFEFYVRFALKEECYSYADIFREMQNFYETPENQDRQQLLGGVVVLGRSYVCKDFNDGQWHRVRVHKVHPTQRTAEVFYCDLAKLQEVSYDALLEIDPQYAKPSAQVFLCYLYDILPISEKGLEWDEKAIEFCKELVMGKELQGICQARSDKVVKPGYPDAITSLGMVFIDRHEKGCTINAQMVENGFAFSIGIFGACKHTIETPGLIPKFDLMRFREEHDIPPSPIKQKEPMPDIINSEQMRLLMSSKARLSRPQKNWGGKASIRKNEAFCNNPNVTTTEPYANTTERLPVRFVDALAFVKMCFVTGPSCMIIHVHSQSKELIDMQTAIKKLVENEPPVPLAEGKPGDIVACLILDNTTDHGSVWCRAVIRRGNPKSDSFKLILADYGNEVHVKYTFCRRLPECFHNIPSFAIRCHLDSPFVAPRGRTGWSTDACLFFRRYVFHWESAQPTYYLHRRSNEVIEFEDYNQNVMYDLLTESWVAGLEKRNPANQAINQLRNHPMFYSHFRSLGVELFYEVTTGGSHYWYFDRLADTLVQHNFSDMEMCPKGKDTIHRDIVALHDHITVERIAGWEKVFSPKEYKLPSEPVTTAKSKVPPPPPTKTFSDRVNRGEGRKNKVVSVSIHGIKVVMTGAEMHVGQKP